MTTRRRDILKLAALAPLAAIPALAAVEAAPRRLLILVELRGGNDGLNTVVPYDDPAYRQLRPRIGIAREEVVALTDQYICFVDGASYVITFSYDSGTPQDRREEEVAAMLASWRWG